MSSRNSSSHWNAATTTHRYRRFTDLNVLKVLEATEESARTGREVDTRHGVMTIWNLHS